MNDLFFRTGIELTDDQKQQLIEILTKRCREKTYRRIKSIITYHLDVIIKSCFWLDRFYISHLNNEVHYCAFQSYPCEIKAIRNNILKKYP